MLMRTSSYVELILYCLYPFQNTRGSKLDLHTKCWIFIYNFDYDCFFPFRVLMIFSVHVYDYLNCFFLESVNKRRNLTREITPLFSEDVYKKYFSKNTHKNLRAKHLIY